MFANERLTLKKASLRVMMSGTFQKCWPNPSFTTSIHALDRKNKKDVLVRPTQQEYYPVGQST